MSTSVITALAILKVNHDEMRQDYIGNFVPMVCECLRCMTSDIISLPDLQEEFRKRFGIKLPQHVLKTLLKRLRDKKCVILDKSCYRINREELNKEQFRQFSTVQRQVIEGYEALIRRLVEYASKRLGSSWTHAEAEAAIEEFMEDWQIKFDWSGGRRVLQSETHKEARYIVASFLRELQEQCAPEFAFFETIFQGHMLANAIYLPEPNQALKKFKATEVYFDTAFLICSLGYAGEPRKAPCIELLQLLNKTGAHLRCFEHTRDEIRGVLDACAAKIRNNQLRDAYGQTMEYFITKGYKASDIELFSAQLERNLEQLGIKVVPKPDYNNRLFIIDEPALSSYLGEHVSYRNPQAKDRDVDSISAIYRLRKGRKSRFIEECGAVFVTTNYALAHACREFFSADYEGGNVPAVITDQYLTNVLWLKTPTEAPDLPRKRIIADCYAATQPDERLWQKYLDEINRLQQFGNVTAEDYYVLRYSIEARQALMDLTRGQEEAFTEGTVEEILEIVHAQIRKEAEEKLERERELRRAAEAEVAAGITRENLRRMNIRNRSLKISLRIIWILKGVIMALMVCVTLYTFPWDLPRPRTGWARYALTLLEVLLMVLTVYNLMYGTAVKDILRKLEAAIAQRLESWFWGLYDTIDNADDH